MRRPRSRRPWGVVLWLGLLVLAAWPGVLPGVLAAWTGGPVTLPDVPVWRLVLDHLGLVALAEAVVVLVGVPLAVLVTRPGNRVLLGLAEALVGLGQTVPTLAILALAVPFVGFGVAPTLLGLVLYGLVPVVSNGVAGLLGVDRGVLAAAAGMGMTSWQRLLRVEAPLALPVWLGGLRTSTVYNVGTATVGAALGAGGLGAPIINGLSRQDPGLVFQGALLAALLALTLDAALGLIASDSEQSR